MCVNIVKLGGSVITEKAKGEQEINFRVVRNLGLEIKSLMDQGEKFIIIHGAGSFGHVNAQKYGVNRDWSIEKSAYNRKLSGVVKIQNDMHNLNFMVVSTLMECGIKAVGVCTNNISVNRNKKLSYMYIDNIIKYLEHNIVPVIYGDVVNDIGRNPFSITSGDDIILYLSSNINNVRKAVFVMDVDGVYDRDPKSNIEIRRRQRKPQLIDNIYMGKELNIDTRSRGNVKDVTQRMEGKLKSIFEIASLGIDVYCVNGFVRERLKNALVGHSFRGTHIHPEAKDENKS